MVKSILKTWSGTILRVMVISGVKRLKVKRRSGYYCNESTILTFREFLAWIMEADKQFVIIGNINAISYKEVFPSLRIIRCG